MGLDYFYGFVGGDANQWKPNLFRNTTAIYPYVGNPKRNLITAQADDCIEYMRRITAINEKQPRFIYYVPGAVHAPHHPSRSGSRRSATCTCSIRVVVVGQGDPSGQAGCCWAAATCVVKAVNAIARGLMMFSLRLRIILLGLPPPPFHSRGSSSR
jgi:hypothetical protein